MVSDSLSGTASATPPHWSDMLRIEGLVKRYKTGDMALEGRRSLGVAPGQVIGLIGPSGAGKSTLIRCINRLVEPTAGRIFLGDIEITGLGGPALRRMRRRMGMIFQEFALVERLTVMENVLAGRLGYAGFWRSLLRRYPASRHRHAFAPARARRPARPCRQARRCVVRRPAPARRDRPRPPQEPELLLIDEPTASLDPKTSRQIMRLLGGIVPRAQSCPRWSISTTSCWPRCSCRASSV